MAGRSRFTRVPAAGVLLVATTAAHGLVLTVSSDFGEPIDRAPTFVALQGQGTALDCTQPPRQQWNGNVLTITVQRYRDPAVSAGCTGAFRADVGVLAPGRYRAVAIELDAASGVENERRVVDFDVKAMDGPGRCARLPELVPQLWVAHHTLSAEAFVARLASDPAYAARLGNPVPQLPSVPGARSLWLSYPPLDDPTARHWKLAQTGEFAQIGHNGYAYGVPPPDTVGTFVEFRNTRLDHYFYTANAPEIVAIEAGLVGAGWIRTGESFRAYVRLGVPNAAPQEVAYRFTGTPDVGPSTHVFTVNREECFELAQDPQWLFEGLPLAASPLAFDGGCPPREVPLYRVWKPFGVSNHRFTTKPAVVQATVARDWIAEGPAMCVLPDAAADDVQP